MGHLINSNSIRIGWFSRWTDSWYITKSYYSEYVFLIYRIRLFLIFFFSSKLMDKLGFSYSHFEIINKYNSFIINIYIYDSKIETYINNIKYKLTIQDKARFNFNLRSYSIVKGWRFLRILNALYNFDFNNWKIKNLKFLIYILNYFNYMHLFFILKKLTLDKKKNRLFSVFLFFLELCYQVKFSMKKYSESWAISIDSILNRLIYSVAWITWNFNLFSNLKDFIIFISEKLSNNNNINVNFFVINNYSLTAQFLARFIARKLKQNIFIYHVLNPIKKELIRIRSNTKPVFSRYLYNLNKAFFSKYSFINNYLNFFKYFVFYISFLFKKYILFFYKKTKSYIFLDVLSFMFFNINLNIYFHKVLNYKIFDLFSDRNKIFYFMDNKLKNSSILSFLNLYFYSNYNLKDLNFFQNNYDIMDYFIFSFSGKSLNRYLNFNFWNLNNNLIHKLNNINKIKIRVSLLKKPYSLLGFKISCVGRFSRKQRASSVWFRQFKTPLNTLSAYIDYSDFTVALKNSASTVKVWLYKNNNFSKYYFKII